MKRLLLLGLLALSCARSQPQPSRPGAGLDSVGIAYAKLVLAMEKHDADYVDAFYGPPEWLEEAKRDSLPLTVIRTRADSLITALAAYSAPASDTLGSLRYRFLQHQLSSLITRVRMLSGEHFRFDEESEGLYGAVAPTIPDSAFAPVLARLDSLLPGKGPLVDRYLAYRETLVIPPDRVDTVFQTAIREAQRRTRAHIALPDSESFRVEYVRGEEWGGYNWYQGNYHSLIQVNVELPVYIDRALDLACHEGYPGHHVANVLLEQRLRREYGWDEFSVVPLYSPASLINEGSANVAPEVVFSPEERRRFEKDVLFPLAGIDTTVIERYDRIRAALDGLALARLQISRRYLNGEVTREQAIRWRMRHTLQRRDFAGKSVDFDDRYRSYVINYGLGETMVREWLRANGGGAGNSARSWELFERLISTPMLPEDLTTTRTASR